MRTYTIYLPGQARINGTPQPSKTARSKVSVGTSKRFQCENTTGAVGPGLDDVMTLKETKAQLETVVESAADVLEELADLSVMVEEMGGFDEMQTQLAEMCAERERMMEGMAELERRLALAQGAMPPLQGRAS